MTDAHDVPSLKRATEALNVTVRHDERARVWYVEQSELPGLHAEAATLDELVSIIEDLAPELAANVSENEGSRQSSPPICVRHVVHARRAQAA